MATKIIDGNEIRRRIKEKRIRNLENRNKEQQKNLQEKGEKIFSFF